MALIKISNLNPAGSDLFANSESFLTELHETDTNQIFGGGGHGSGGGSKKGSKGGGYCPPPPPPPCYPYYPCH